MSETRPTLTASLSFGGSSSAASSRTLKRRLTTPPELPFFTPAATSFKPKPYAPNGASNPLPKVPQVRSLSAASLAQQIAIMDPSPSDPHVVFIHPPFTTFPDSHLYPEGLCYSLMAANPEWFLDQNDFVGTASTNPAAIPYPPQLEPPRGWCPAKKKDLKALGPDGWPQGEEPRLRCTFCRRTYAGVNAKSMWRRHVYEKHKIAMSNRRDGNDRTRGGRGSHRDHRNGTSDKENVLDDSHRSLKAPAIPDQTLTKPTKLRGLFPPSTTHARSSANVRLGSAEDSDDTPIPSAPIIEQTEFSPPPSPQDASQPRPQSLSALTRADSTPMSPASPARAAMNASIDMSVSPRSPRFAVPMSPYDPLLTPSFRHSPPRLPSDQPWRFPSPSHPLHSKAREFCLSTLVRGGISPACKGVPAIDSSPASMGPPSVLNTPCNVTRRKIVDDLDAGPVESSSPSIFRPSPRQLFPRGQSPFSMIHRMDFRKRINESPLTGGLWRRTHARRKSTMNSSSDIQSDWLSDASSSGLSASGVLADPIRLASDDPFGGIYKPFAESNVRHDVVDKDISIPLLSSPEAESPVVRKIRTPGHPESATADEGAELIGLGIGLMAPFTLPVDRKTERKALRRKFEATGDIAGDAEESDEAEVEGVLASEDVASDSDTLSEVAPPLKKRRKTIDRREA
ncbi:hypothetical protein BV22DRAFT_1190830 [Leucogyrophana mollusca]|uniref:Uncharacterized protein n=1 Tax=Leucogyrophana mollusca TaxID=85980 RepID=A0ACB8C0H0_9AGAM|nr:hypothetical protein BV22DRAFT_1190830 [Leucogyrophana mollusca]